MWGPHVIRKWERRAVLSVEYGIKALCASAARLVAATPPDKDTARLHAWVGGATPAVLQANGAEIVSTVGPGSFIVTLPRGDAFTRSLVGLVGGGVKVLDVAGNDEIALTAIVRQPAPESAAVEEAPPAGRVLASDPLLTEPAARRLTVRAPLARLAEIAAWLQRRGRGARASLRLLNRVCAPAAVRCFVRRASRPRCKVDGSTTTWEDST